MYYLGRWKEYYLGKGGRYAAWVMVNTETVRGSFISAGNAVEFLVKIPKDMQNICYDIDGKVVGGVESQRFNPDWVGCPEDRLCIAGNTFSVNGASVYYGNEKVAECDKAIVKAILGYACKMDRYWLVELKLVLEGFSLVRLLIWLIPDMGVAQVMPVSESTVPFYIANRDRHLTVYLARMSLLLGLDL